MLNSTGLTGLLPYPHGNATLIEFSELCTKALCDLTLAHVGYLPSLPGNALYASLFVLCFGAQLILGIKWRCWGFMAATTIGILTEVIGYVGRIMMNNDPFSKNNFLIYLVTLTIAPAFLSAAIYLCLARIVVVYGEDKSRVKPRTYTILFCSCDFLALLLQSIGGAIASISNTTSGTQLGINIMLAGLSFQVFSLLLFSSACIEFGLNVYRSTRASNNSHHSNHIDSSRPTSPSSITFPKPLHESLPQTKLFRAFLVAFSVATLAIFIRSCFRVAELSGGFHGSLANNEVSFMTLEGAMVILACLALTIFHPGVCFQGEWRAVNFQMGRTGNNGHHGGDMEAKATTSSRSTSVASNEHAGTFAMEPPVYSPSSIAGDSFDDTDSIRGEGCMAGLQATMITALPVRPGEVHVEMLPVYGIRYESTRDNFPPPVMV